MSMVDGTTTGADAHGVVQGNGGASDRMSNSGDGGMSTFVASSSAGKDTLEGHSSFNQYYGGDGSDTFILGAKFAATAHQGASTTFADQFAYIADFQGAGGYSATNNDFLALSGFGSGSHIDLVHTGTSGTAGAMLYYYTITDGVSGAVVNFEINSTNGHALGAGDYAFY